MKAMTAIKKYFGSDGRPVGLAELKALRGFGSPAEEKTAAQADYDELAAGAAVELGVTLD